MSANRNKFSVAADIATPEGQRLVQTLAANADVVIENFKPGGLAKYGLDHVALLAAHPSLVYCSISGFGQTGPNRDKPGYDLMAQGYGGIMSLTGDPDGEPMKVAVGIADVVCGLYAAVGILSALRHCDRTGEGQHIDLALVDTQVSWLINEGVAHLTTSAPRKRRGNAHATIVPYQVFAVIDGYVIVAVGNDSQFRRLCEFLGVPEIGEDPTYATNPARIEHREELVTRLETLLSQRSKADVIEGLEERRVPVGPVNTLDEVFQTDQVAARGMRIDMERKDIDRKGVELIGNPLKMSRTPVSYRRPPPRFGEDSQEILDWLSDKTGGDD
jgi:formyl-CoA transferase